MTKLKKLLLATLLSSTTLFAGFTTVDCTNQTHLDTLKLPQVECEILDAFWTAMGDGAGWTDKEGWDTLTYAGEWSGVYMYDDNSSIWAFGWGDGRGNNLSGEVPESITDFIALEAVALGSNTLYGSLPELSLSNNIYYINFMDNQFTGSIPNSYANLTKLKKLLLSKNQLSGPLPDLSQLAVLEDFRIQENNFTFSDIEPQIDYIKDLQSLEYDNQAPINENTHPIVYFDDTLSITPSLASNPSGNDYYIWKKDDVVVEGTDGSRIYVKTSATTEDAGCYSYDVNNSKVTLPNGNGIFRNLVLHSSTCIQAVYNHAPLIADTNPNESVNEAETYTYTSAISDADNEDLTVTTLTLPSWLTFSSDAGNFTLTGTPNYEDVGSYDINITVTDTTTPVHINYTLTVLPKDIAPVNIGYRHKISTNEILSTLEPKVHSYYDLAEKRLYFIENNVCQGTAAAYIALVNRGALFTAFKNCTDNSYTQTLDISTPYPNGSKATLVKEPSTNKAMIMIEVPLTSHITIGD